MTKAEVLAKLALFKGKPVELCVGDNLMAVLGGIPGHWLFSGENDIIEIKKNTGSTNAAINTEGATQIENPFSVQYIPYDAIVSIKSFMNPRTDNLTTILNGYTPINTDDTLATIIEAIESDSINGAHSPLPMVSDKNVTSGEYGTFNGIALSVDGKVPDNIKRMANISVD